MVILTENATFKHSFFHSRDILQDENDLTNSTDVKYSIKKKKIHSGGWI